MPTGVADSAAIAPDTLSVGLLSDAIAHPWGSVGGQNGPWWATVAQPKF